METKFADSNIEALQRFFPPSAQYIISLVKMPKAIAIIEKFGGATLRLSKGSRDFGRLVEVVGNETAGLILAHPNSDDQLLVPRCAEALRMVRNTKIQKEFDRMTQKSGLSAKESVRSLGETFRLTERQVWRVLKQSIDSALVTKIV